ncbi:hypothetical protein [Petralouisia muris]|nr:hypothetical protein [Petralouisia muris]
MILFKGDIGYAKGNEDIETIMANLKMGMKMEMFMLLDKVKAFTDEGKV